MLQAEFNDSISKVYANWNMKLVGVLYFYAFHSSNALFAFYENYVTLNGIFLNKSVGLN